MRTSVLYLAHDRLELMHKTLPRLIQFAGAPFRLVLWDNHSREPVSAFFNSIVPLCRKYNVEVVIHSSPQNLPISVVFNKYARENPTEFVGQMGNDILLSDDWLVACLDAIVRNPKLATVAGYHFNFAHRVQDGEDFFKRARDFKGVRLVTAPHLGGLYVFRRVLWERFGPVLEFPRDALGGRGFFLGSTSFQKSLTSGGFMCAYLADHYWEHLSQFEGSEEYVRRVKSNPKGPPL